MLVAVLIPVLTPKVALHFINGAYMCIGKCLHTTLSIILGALITYYTVVMLNQIEAITLMQKLVKTLSIFSIIYTCGKLIPHLLVKVFWGAKVIFFRMSKSQSKTEPFN